jgi:hypothetical protein
MMHVTPLLMPDGTNMLVLYRGKDNSLYSRTGGPAGGPWSPEQSNEGTVNSSISAATDPATGNTILFYRGVDEGLKTRLVHPDGTVAGEVGFGQGQNLTSDITPVTVSGPGPEDIALQIYYRGIGNGLVMRQLTPTESWTEEQNLGGILTSNVTAIGVPVNTLVVLYGGPDNSIVTREFDTGTGTWSAEATIGGPLVGNITACFDPGTLTVELFYRSWNGQIVTMTRDTSGNWSDQFVFGGDAIGDITVAAIHDGILQVFYRGLTNSVVTASRAADGTWSGLATLAGRYITADVSAIVVPPAVPQIFYRGIDNSLWTQFSYPDGRWPAEQNIGGSVF